MKKDRKKNLRIARTLALIPIAAAILFGILYPLIFGKSHLRRITYPAGQAESVGTDKEMTVWFFDVGQADASLIRTPDGKYLMIDAGSNESEKLLAAYLKELGVKKIDTLFLSHEHEDHIGGADLLIRDFGVSRVVINRYPDDSVTAEKLLRDVNDRDLKLSLPENGEIFVCGDLNITVMLPVTETGDNNDCAVYRVQYGNTVILYTGDVEAEGEKRLLSDFPLLMNSDVLKTGHHGSSSSTSKAFLERVSPAYAVISCGAANEYGHPNEEVLERLNSAGCKVSRTDLDGTIVFRSDGENLY